MAPMLPDASTLTAEEIHLFRVHQAQLARLNRLYAALSQIGQTVARARTSGDVFGSVCRILVEVSGFKMAWVGWRNQKTQQIEPLASHGDSDHYLDTINVYADDRPEGRGPTGVCVRENRCFVCNDFVGETRTMPWREAAARSGFLASISIPLLQGGRVVGALTCYATERDFFGEKEVELCNEAGQALTLALDKFEQESQLLRAQRLENIGMLAAGIAHDLNNVLAPISMAVPLLRRPDADPEEQRVLDSLERCAERGAGLVRQVLGFVQGVSGEPQLMQLRHVLRDVLQMVVETFPKTIVVEDRIPKDLWPVVANPTQVQQVVLNLCLNARDAMPAGGRLRLDAENVTLEKAEAVRLGLSNGGSWLRLRVVDDGVGMGPEVLARIWEPFFTTKGVGKGTGLGLPTVRGIVERHGGCITVRSEPGRGAEFQVYLPAAELRSESASEELMAGAQGGRKQAVILLVDDELSVRELMRVTLMHAGHVVTVAEDGAKALSLFAQSPESFDLVLTDLDMPVLGGVDLVRALRRLRAKLRVLVISGLESEDPVERWQTFADGFLQKPFTTEGLLRAVRLVLSRAEKGAGA